MSAALIGIDWGTSSFRAWRMDRDGAVIDSVAEGPGILVAAARPGGFEAALQEVLGPWLGSAPIIASGMVTSRNGWAETPYLPLPLDAGALAAALHPHRCGLGVVHLVTGAVSDPDGPAPDVMRGEETEIVGHLADGAGEGLFVLPGTHSKWARAEAGRLVRFRTAMTGELFQLLRDGSILGRLARPGPFSAEGFARGLEAGRAGGSLAGRLFSARVLPLLDRMAGDQVADYLSGLLIGDEVAQGLAGHAGGAPVIIGRGDLAERYRLAFAAFGQEAQVAAPGMARRGLWEIARRAGIIA